MNQHVGASFTLSVLVVIFFAVILYEPDRARPDSSLSPATQPAEATPAPPPTPGVPLIESASAPREVDTPDSPTPNPHSPPTAQPGPSLHPIEAIASLETHRAPSPSTKPKLSPPVATPSPRVRVAPAPPPPIVTPGPPPRIQAVSRRQPVPPPGRRSAFTQVRDGESLTDVALRVYGNSEAAVSLWSANRDVIAHRETPLNPGLLLRTP